MCVGLTNLRLTLPSGTTIIVTAVLKNVMKKGKYMSRCTSKQYVHILIYKIMIFLILLEYMNTIFNKSYIRMHAVFIQVQVQQYVLQ